MLNNVPVKWKVQQGYEKNVKLSTSEGYECVVGMVGCSGLRVAVILKPLSGMNFLGLYGVISLYLN